MYPPADRSSNRARSARTGVASQYPLGVHPLDTLGRPVRDLRISVTDRCNFRCAYCMPKSVFGHDYRFMDRKELLSFEELERVARAFVALGRREDPAHGRRAAAAQGARDASSSRLAAIDGPRSHADDERLAPRAEGPGAARRRPRPRQRQPRLARRRDVPGDERRRLPRRARAGGDRGRRRRRAAREGERGREAQASTTPASSTWRATSAAPGTRSASSSTWTSARRTAGGSTTSFPRREIVERIDAVFPLEPVEAAYRGEVAQRWRYRDGAGEIGVISSVTQPFCGDCTRARISAEGKLYTCLFASRGTDLRALLRSGATRRGVERSDRRASGPARTDRYSEIRTERTSELPAHRDVLHRRV